MKFRSRDAVALGLALAAAWLAYRFVLDLELVGWDSYPILAASHPADLSTTLFDRWMGGRYPRGDFYRPLSTLSFALDRALWDLVPRGFQRTNLLTLLFATGCSYGLARAWLGHSVAAGVAALCFALHPAQLEVVPVAARRSDLLAAGLMAAALWAQPLEPRGSRARLVLGAGLALLASAAKETGVAVLPAIVALHAGLAPQARGRLGFALTRSLPAIAAVAGFLVLRTWVLGGLGGHPGSDTLSGLLSGALAAPGWLAALVMPQPWTETALDAPVAIALLVALAMASRWAAREAALRAPLLALATWAASLLLLMGISGDRASWSLVPLLGPYVILLGALAAFARTAYKTSAVRARFAAGVCGVLLLGYGATSSLIRDYESWRRVSDASAQFLARFDAAVENAHEAGRLTLGDLPLGTATPLQRIGVRSAFGLSDYSVAAYAELRFPAREIHVVVRGQPPQAAPPGALSIEVEPANTPLAAAWREAHP